MKTLLIPVDFSSMAENVLNYAADFSCETSIDRIIVLKSFYVSPYSQLYPSADFVQLTDDEIAEERQQVIEDLKILSHKTLKNCNPLVKIDNIISDLPLLRAIHQVIEQENPYLLMIGSDNDLAESYIGEQIIAIAKTSTVPVYIVPNKTRFEKINKAVVPCDFNSIERLNALNAFKNASKFIHPDLLVLNVDPFQSHKADDPDLGKMLATVLEGFKFEVHVTGDKDIVMGIIHFADVQNAQLIIALPGRYSFFYNLTHKSITKALALNAHRAVLILK